MLDYCAACLRPFNEEHKHKKFLNCGCATCGEEKCIICIILSE